MVSKLNLKDIQILLENNKISKTDKIDLKLLKSRKIIKKYYDEIKILGSGEIKEKINLEVNYLSNSAKEKLNKSGSTVKILNVK